MQDEQKSVRQDDEQAVSSLRTQQIIEHLEKQWGRPHEPSHDDFKYITEFVINLPEEYRSVGLTIIAEHLVNGMGLHILAIMAKFQQLTEQEGMSVQECQETFNDTLPTAFQTLHALSKQISVTSLDELAALNNITIALYTLSKVNTVEEAQTWLYELPMTYYRRLVHAGLLVDTQNRKQGVRNNRTSSASKFLYTMPDEHSQPHVVNE